MDEAAYDQQPIGTVGAELCAAREAQQLSLADVAQRTRIPLRHLAAIEQADYPKLPAATYSAGFVRTYARLLGLDAHALSQRFRAELAQQAPTGVRREEYYAPTDPARVPSRGLAWGALALAVVLVLGFLYWRGTQLENPADVVAAPGAPASQPAPQPAAPAPGQPQPGPIQPGPAQPGQPQPATAPVAAPTDTALLTADQPVWLRVTDGSSKLFQGVLNPGDHFQVPATAADPRLRTSRATALKVTVGPVAIPPLGPAETLIKDVSLKADALVARTAPPAPQTPAPPTPAPPAPAPVAPQH